MRLMHILIPQAITLAIVIFASPYLPRPSNPMHFYVLTLFGLLISFIFSWPVCKILGVPPLSILFGPCPHCGTRPDGWRVTGHLKARLGRLPDKVELACGHCSGFVTLWLKRKVPRNLVQEGTTTYCLRWPEFFGVWRKLGRQP